MTGGIDVGGDAARGVVGVRVGDRAVGEELLTRDGAAEAVLLAGAVLG